MRDEGVKRVSEVVRSEGVEEGVSDVHVRGEGVRGEGVRGEE